MAMATPARENQCGFLFLFQGRAHAAASPGRKSHVVDKFML